MRTFLTILTTAILGSSTGTSLITTNIIVDISKQNNKEIHEVKIFLKKNERLIKTYYAPNNPRASFRFIKLNKYINNINSKIDLTVNKINFKNEQTQIHEKKIDCLSKTIFLFESFDFANPNYWNDQDFNLRTTTIYSDTIKEGVTRYAGKLKMQLTKDTKTGEIFFICGVYGKVNIGNNQGKVSGEIENIELKW